MRKTETLQIKELVEALMRKYGVDDKLAEVRLIRAWDELLGKSVGKYCKNIFIKDRKLFVSISSSIVKTEVLMIKDELVKRLNEKAGKNLINQIIIR
jgi:predicted nucleic acid-binding Zn ribbon protein